MRLILKLESCEKVGRVKTLLINVSEVHQVSGCKDFEAEKIVERWDRGSDANPTSPFVTLEL